MTTKIESLEGRTVTINGMLCTLHITKYSHSFNGVPCIHLTCRSDGDDGYDEPYATLTVNLPEKVDDDEIIVKTWGENVNLKSALLKNTDWFKDTGRRISTGFVQAEVWKVVK